MAVLRVADGARAMSALMSARSMKTREWIELGAGVVAGLEEPLSGAAEGGDWTAGDWQPLATKADGSGAAMIAWICSRTS